MIMKYMIIIFFIISPKIWAKMTLKIGAPNAIPPYHEYDTTNSKLTGIVTKGFGRILCRFLEMNFTYIMDGYSVGSTTVNGTKYDGIIGLIQRNEAEMAIYPVPLDTPHDPGLYGPVCYPFEAIMMTAFKPTAYKAVDVVKASQNIFDRHFWIFFSIFCLLFFVIFSLINKLIGDGLYMLEGVWNMICIILENFDLNSGKSYSKPILIVFIIFIDLITILFMNLFATSLIVKPDPDYVNTFEEIPKRGLKPYFIKTLTYWNQFSNAESGSYKKVWDVCKKNGTDQCLLSEENPNIERVYNGIENEDLALFTPTVVLPFLYPLAKAMFPDKHVHVAEERMLPSSYAYLYSKNISNEKREILDQKLRRTVETGIFHKAVNDMINLVTTDLGQSLNKNISSSYRIEFDEINRTEESEANEGDDSRWSQIRMDNLESIFKFLICSFIVGAIILNIEYIINFK